MKNILIVTSALYIGGAEQVIANLVRHIDTKRFRTSVCLLRGRGEIGEELLREGHHVLEIPAASGAGRYLSFVRLRRLVREQRIHLMHSHTTHSLADAALVKLTCPGIKMVHTFHRGNYPNHIRHYMLMERIFSRVPERLIAVGNEQRKSIVESFHFPAHRIAVIPNGVDALPPDVDREWQERLQRDGRPVIGTISTLIEQKGIAYLLDTARRLADRGIEANFVIVGDGVLRPALEARCRDLELTDRVHFAGWKHNASTTMLPLFDVFFQPSLWEAMSMVVIEAMAAGKPVVATDVGDNRHMVVTDETGMIVPPKDVGGMAHALQALILSAGKRRDFGRAGRARFEEQYTAGLMARKYEDVYSELLGSHDWQS